MTREQQDAIKCAYADLCGTMEAYLQDDIHSHDWRGQIITLLELVQAFDFLEPLPAALSDEVTQ